VLCRRAEEAFSMLTLLSRPQKKEDTLRVSIPEVAFCDEKNQLLDEFLEAIHEITTVQSLQTQALIDGDPDFTRFDVLLHFAQERKEQAKYAWIAHVESHHCERG
jgi:hypothetical protein